MKKEKALEAILVIAIGFLLIYILKEQKIFLYISFSVGLVGIFIKPLAVLIAKGWYKLGDILGVVVSKVVLSLIFFLLVTPIALLHNLFNKDSLRLKKSDQTFWSNRDHFYVPEDFDKIW